MPASCALVLEVRPYATTSARACMTTPVGGSFIVLPRSRLPERWSTAPGLRRPVAMLTVLLIVWAALVVAVCAICAAGGAADERREQWYAELKKRQDSAPDSKDVA